MNNEERKAFIHLNLYEMSPAEIACYARDARKELEACDLELVRLREEVVRLERQVREWNAVGSTRMTDHGLNIADVARERDTLRTALCIAREAIRHTLKGCAYCQGTGTGWDGGICLGESCLMMREALQPANASKR